MGLRTFLAIVVALALTGCAPTTRLTPTCLPMAEYASVKQKALANANRALDNPMIPPEVREPLRTAVSEYVALRAANRAACAH